jgi:alpha-tubulin suppressor-like RCC1 family protein
MSNGKVKCWGDNSAGQLGSPGQSSSSSPLEVPGLPSVMWISAGLDFACAVASADHTVWCWGNNTIGQLGRSASTSPGAPSVVDKLAEANSVVAGTDFACALLSGVSSGLISCWGGNHWGQLGDGLTDTSPTPVPVAGLTNAVQVVASASSLIPLSTDGPTACARLADGKVACWGDNSMGALGDPSNTSSWSVQPANVAALEGVSELAAGSDFFCSIVSIGGVGGVKCWGWSTNGQLGPQVTVPDVSATPTPVMNLNNVTHLSAGTAHVCALLGSGSVYCWGYNLFGQLGNGTIVDSATPVQAI